MLTEPVDIVPRMWAKSANGDVRWHPLWCHLIDTAAVCSALLPRFTGVLPLPPVWLMYLVGLHDIGKADPRFQNKDESLALPLRDLGLRMPDLPEPFRHEVRSREWVQDHLWNTCGWARRAALVAAQALHGHHGDFQAEAYREEDSQADTWNPLRAAVADRIADAIGLGDAPFRAEGFAHESAVGVALAGLTVLSDWIASNEKVFRYHTLPMDASPLAYFEAARAEAERAIRRLGFHGTPAPYSSPPRFNDVWPELQPPRPTQAALEAECLLGLPPGLLIVEAPMGEGKTEAAIFAVEAWNRAAGRDGAYLALPTQATSNQMHGRYADYRNRVSPDRDAPRLVHGMAWLLDEATPEGVPQTWGDGEPDDSSSWFRNQKRALLAPHGVGTVDQALMAALNVKHGFLRLLGLSSKVFVIDEVHAYDKYMTTIMERLLSWCAALRVPVILLSATLSRHQKERLADAYRGPNTLPPMPAEGDAYPLITLVPMEGDVRSVAVPNDPTRARTIQLMRHPGLLDDPVGTARLATEEVRGGGCACVLVNTVNAAQAVFRALRELAPADTELFLFHARFRAERRDEIEREIAGRFGKNAGRDGNPPRPARAIVVGTQVLEQSLDLDWDVLISQVAPVDLLLQRAGRLHRHERGERPTGPDATLHILLPLEGTLDFDASERVYHRLPLLRTLALLHGRAAIHLPADFRPLVEGVYGDAPVLADVVPASEIAAAEGTWRHDLAEAEQAARTHLIAEPNPEEFRLAYLPERPVQEDEDGTRHSYFHARTRQEDEYSVSVLALHDPDLLHAARQATRPPLRVLRRLFLQKASIPAWWLTGIQPAEGFDEIADGPPWLRGQRILPLQDREWRGIGPEGEISIYDDPIVGLLREGGDYP